MSEAPAPDASSPSEPARDADASLVDRPARSGVVRRLAGFVRQHWLLLLPAFLYVYVFPYQPLLHSPNELCRLLQSRALIDYQTIELNQVMRERGPVGDLSCVAVARAPDGRIVKLSPCPQASADARFCERHFFPSKAPLLGFAAAPFYLALKWLAGDVPELALMFFARLFCMVLPSLILLVLIRRFLAAMVSAPLAGLVTLAYALGTLAFSYTEQFVSHQTTAVLTFACFYGLWRLRRGEWPRWGYAALGLLAGLAIAAEYTAALALLPIGIYGALTAAGGARSKAGAALLALAGFLPPVLLLGYYHLAAFGHPLATGYRYLNDYGFQSWHQGGLLGIGLPEARAFVQSFLSPSRGLFTLSPMLVLALPYLLDPRNLRARTAEMWLSLGIALAYTYFTSSFAYDSWGWSTGPRHLTPLIPFLLLPLALLLRSLGQSPGPGREPGSAWWQVVLAGVAAGLVPLSVATTSLMTLLNYVSPNFTNPIYQVALPLAVRGYLPHTWLSLAGVPNPWAALPAIAALVVAMGTCAVLVVRSAPPARRLPVVATAMATLAVAAALQTAVHTRPERFMREAQAASYMGAVYVPRPNQPPPTLWAADHSFGPFEPSTRDVFTANLAPACLKTPAGP